MKKVLFGLAVVAVVALGTYEAMQTSIDESLNDLQLENLEALGNYTGDNPPFCPWGVAEFYVSPKNGKNNTSSAFCDCTPITYHAARRTCDGKELVRGHDWSIIINSDND